MVKKSSAEPQQTDQSLIKAISALTFSDKDIQRQKVIELLEIRLSTEFLVITGIKLGIDTDQITVENGAQLLSRCSKVDELFKIVQLLDGNPTDNIAVTLESIVKSIAQKNRLTGIN